MTVRSACSCEGMVVFVVTYCQLEDWYMVRFWQGKRLGTLLHSRVGLLGRKCGM